MGNLGFHSWEGHEPQDNLRGKWAGPTDACLHIQKLVNKINDRLVKQKKAKYTYAKDGFIPYRKDD